MDRTQKAGDTGADGQLLQSEERSLEGFTRGEDIRIEPSQYFTNVTVRRLKRDSRWRAILSGIGITMLIGALIYSNVQLWIANRELMAIQSDYFTHKTQEIKLTNLIPIAQIGDDYKFYVTRKPSAIVSGGYLYRAVLKANTLRRNLKSAVIRFKLDGRDAYSRLLWEDADSHTGVATFVSPLFILSCSEKLTLELTVDNPEAGAVHELDLCSPTPDRKLDFNVTIMKPS